MCNINPHLHLRTHNTHGNKGEIKPHFRLKCFQSTYGNSNEEQVSRRTAETETKEIQ